MNLVQKALLGTAMIATPFVSEAKDKSPNERQITKELGAENMNQVVTQGDYHFLNSDFKKLSYVNAVTNGNAKVTNNGMRQTYNGIVRREVSDSVLEDLDRNNDKIVTTEEISRGSNRQYRKALINHAIETLEVEKSDLTMVDGYFTSKELESKVESLRDIYMNVFKKDAESLYSTINDNNDLVLDKDEIMAGASAMQKVLKDMYSTK